ncbi:Leucine-rich repeat [Macleaya cordata]|uniref:Leucine-rich repeat n=1 Tax=Macleaya cordata TaxID=56857 RepID=A0A200PR17_MACCD|nr:Leucine-rich repeat [Macleaya cordata]
MGSSLQSVDGVVEEIMRIHRSLPTRPALDEVEAARYLILNVEKEEQSRIEAISKQKKSPDVPEELFFVLQEMQRNLVFFQSKEEKREALKLLDLESVHALFDEFVQRASKCLPSGSNSNMSDYSNGSAKMISSSFAPASSSAPVMDSSVLSSSSSFFSEKDSRSSSERFTRDDSYVKKAKATSYTDGLGIRSAASPRPQIVDSSLKPAITSGQNGEKLSLIKLASLIEVSLKKGTRDLNLQNKLMDQIEWLPDSIGKLSGLITLDLSENRITVLPTKIGGLSSLTRLDLHSNRIAELPESIGDLFCLVFLDLRGNQLTSLPATFGKLSRLEELDLSSNRLALLPESIGNLISLKKLNVETNDIEEIPHTIGHCSSLVELHADYNRLKALPEAVGRIESLEILSVRYNNIKQMPTTMASLSKLKELDVSFNELEAVPESLCLATTLVKLNVGNNFADLRSLPRSIGNLEMLEELDISNNQIRFLPDSFGMLSRLRVLRAEENPLEVPPRLVIDKGAQAVVQYMAELVANRAVKAQPVKQKKTWAQFCFFSRPNKRKHDGLDYVKAS